MPLNKTTLATAIIAALDATYEEAKNKDIPDTTVRQNYADRIADAFDTYVKTMTITIAPSVIAVTGSSTAQTNPSPIVLSNTIPNTIS